MVKGSEGHSFLLGAVFSIGCRIIAISFVGERHRDVRGCIRRPPPPTAIYNLAEGGDGLERRLIATRLALAICKGVQPHLFSVSNFDFRALSGELALRQAEDF